jgi:hypothetical protein
MARTTRQRLDAVDAAIEAIESGSQSSTTVLGMTITRANLATLYAQRSELEGLLTAEELTGTPGATRIEIALGGVDDAR